MSKIGSHQKSENRRAQERAIERLRTIFPPGSTVYTFSYGRTRQPGVRVAVFAILDGKIVNVSADASRATGSRWFDENAILVGSPYGFVSSLCERLYNNRNVGQDTLDEYTHKYADGLIQKSL